LVEMCADFTVEGIQALQSTAEKAADRDDARKKDEKAAMRSATRAMEAGSKKQEKQQDEAIKNEEKRRRKIVEIRVNRRFAAFPRLKDKVPVCGKTASLTELLEVDESQRLELDLQGGEERLMCVFQQSLMMVESIVGDGTTLSFLPPNMRFDLRGLGSLAYSGAFQQRLMPLVVETTIEYPQWLHLGLGIRWAQAIYQLMYEVNACNKNKKCPDSEMKKQPPEEEFSAEVKRK